jgi:predicted branched-subunit amino acid permease
MVIPPPIPSQVPETASGSAFLRGLRAAGSSVFIYVLSGTYIGIGALAHDLGFSLSWVMLSTALVWAAPAQVILISALGRGSGLAEAAIAVGLSGVRLLPMVVALLPLIKTPQTPNWRLVLPAHFTAVSMWVEGLRLAPHVPRGQRIAFCNGIGAGMVVAAVVATAAGFLLAAQLPVLFGAALLCLTPLSFLMSIARNSRMLSDRLALLFGLVLAPVLASHDVGLDLMWTGAIGGTLAYAVYRVREALR